MHSDSPSVAVVGAAGFVGRELLRQLEAQSIQVTAIVRGLPELSVDGDFHLARSHQDVAPHSFDVVVNLAYPTSGKPFEQPSQNTAIADTVNSLVSDGGRLIQVSTLAVFGMALDRRVSAGPVSGVRDDPYVESKIAAERVFVEQQAKRGLSLDIVRLGNVWGRASGAWALPVVQRLLTGRPVGVRKAAGFSNTTDVANVASYLTHLINMPYSDAGARYHHLAEFSSVRWSEWIAPIADVLGVEPVYADSWELQRPGSGLRELVEALRPVSPRNIYKRLAAERVAGSWARTLIRGLPAPAQRRLRNDLTVALIPLPERAEQTFLAIMAGEREFHSVVDPAWTSMLTKEQSLEGVLLWLERG